MPFSVNRVPIRCRPSGALVCGESTVLYTYRAAGAFKGWWAMPTLQDGA